MSSNLTIQEKGLMLSIIETLRCLPELLPFLITSKVDSHCSIGANSP